MRAEPVHAHPHEREPEFRVLEIELFELFEGYGKQARVCPALPGVSGTKGVSASYSSWTSQQAATKSGHAAAA
jgi:hypothetical protein